MAVKVTSGDLKEKVVFKQPVSSLNDEGGQEFDYSTPASTITTWAAIHKPNVKRTTDALADVLIESLDFYVRYSSLTDDVTKDWLLSYTGSDYVINEIDTYSLTNFIRFTAKLRTDG